MSLCQPAILQTVPQQARYLMLRADPALPHALALSSLERLAALCDGERVLLGLGPRLVTQLGATIEGLAALPALSGASGLELPRADWDALLWLRGDDAGALFHLGRALTIAAQPLLSLVEVIDAQRHGRGPNGHGLDLSGYEDGTENPQGDAASAVVATRHAGPGLDGGSFLLLQPWRHDWAALDALAPAALDAAIGRRRSDNAELPDAPPSAHVQRTAQEDFDPPAFLLRRSMPWVRGIEAGLVFAAFAHSPAPILAQLRRMWGADDGVCDALFGFTLPQPGALFWCPPLHAGRIDLRALGVAAA